MLTLDDKLGQLFLLGFRGSTPPQWLLDDIANHNLGGVILFDRHLATVSSDNNIIDTTQLRTLTETLQRAARNGSPLFIAIDQEGGQVTRLSSRRGFPETPSAAELGQQKEAAVRSAANQTATLLNSLGINLNFAPVADINLFRDNPIIGSLGRSFSEKTDVVCDCCRTWIEQHRRHNVLSCLKHFPGHGSSRLDSHRSFVDLTADWSSEELAPYTTLIAEKYVDMVMVGHLRLRQYDREFPATLSPAVVDQLLRRQCGWHGVAVSDDMQMRGITARWGVAEACHRSIAAGIDLIIIGNNLYYDTDILTKIKEKTYRALDRGEISEARIDQAWRRITALKKRLSPLTGENN